MAPFLTPKQQILIAMIEQKVAEVYLLDPDEYAVVIRSALRTAQASQARQMLWYILNDVLAISSVMIGKTYGRDHSTVLQGIRAFKERNTYPEMRAAAKKILDDKEIRELREVVYPPIHTRN